MSRSTTFGMILLVSCLLNLRQIEKTVSGQKNQQNGKQMSSQDQCDDGCTMISRDTTISMGWTINEREILLQFVE